MSTGICVSVKDKANGKTIIRGAKSPDSKVSA